MAFNFVSHYKFDSNSNDSIGTNNGTDTNITYVSGKKGNCASFNGSSSKIVPGSLGSSFASASDFYISVWINPSSTGTDRCIVSDTNSASFGIGFSNAGKIWLRDSAGSFWNETGTSVTNSSWQHFVFQLRTIAGPLFRFDIYKNGSFIETVNVNNFASAVTWQLGVKGASSYWYSGLMDHESFGTGVLSTGEISYLYNGGNPPDIPFTSSFFNFF